MNKINAMIKHLLIACLICIVIGGGVMIAGVALGGTLSDASISVGDWNLLSPWPFHGSGSYQVEDADTADAWTVTADDVYSVPADHIKNLNIVLRKCELVIGASADDQIYVSVDQLGQKYCKVEPDNDTLEIIDTRNDKQMTKQTTIRLRMDIPEDYRFNKVKLDIGAGDIQVEELLTKKMNLAGGAGAFRAQSLTVSDAFDAELGVGDFYIEQAVLGDTKIQCGVGAMEIASCELTGDALFRGGVGDVTIGLDAEEKDYNYHLASGLGRLTVFGKNYHALNKAKEQDNDADYTITLDCGAGAMCIKQAKTTR